MVIVRALDVRRPILATGKCTFLEGEGGDTSVTLVVLMMIIQKHGYRDKCGVTHLGEGRCAFCDTHLARIHVHMHACRIEGEHMCDMICPLMFVRSVRHSHTFVRMQMDLIYDARRRSGGVSIRQTRMCAHERCSDVRSKAYRHASAVSGSSRF